MGTVVETKSNLERPWTAPIDSDHDQVVHTRVQYRLGDEAIVHRMAGSGLDVADLIGGGFANVIAAAAIPGEQVELAALDRKVNLCGPRNHGCTPSVALS